MAKMCKWLAGNLMWICFAMLAAAATPNIQDFRVTPHDLEIIEGTDVLLRCEIDNRAGRVQWTKDGFAFGYSAVIHGYPRYSVLIDEQRGIYNLQIKNASIEDDAEYQCQVGPAAGNPAIRANAKLSIVVPPSSLIIENYKNNAKIDVLARQNVTLKCLAENAMPPAEIIWLKGNKTLTSASSFVNGTALKRFRTTSLLTLAPNVTDDYQDITCEARHKALPPDVPMRTNVKLSVLYAPGPPFFESFDQNKTLRAGQQLEIACRSRGGNPPAQLIWYKNGVQIDSPQRTLGRLTENLYNFTVSEEDNGATLACEAKNIIASAALRAELNLTVYFIAKQLTISGPATAKLGETIQLSCQTLPSNPASRISWSLNGRPVQNFTTEKKEVGKNAWTSSSNLTLTVDTQGKALNIVCSAFNTELGENVLTTHTINVLYPPSRPLLTGYNDGDILNAGSVLKLSCASLGGNPTPQITWYKNDKQINSIYKVIDTKIISEISILTNASDNNAIYKCEVKNEAIELPLFATKSLIVHFPPATVKLSIIPKNLVPGVRAKLVCDSSSSNPPAKVSWWKDGIPVEGFNSITKPGLWGGSVSTLETFINVTKAIDGTVYTCQSTNEELQRSVHETVALEVLYAPKFDNKNLTFVGVEGELLSIELFAHGNPKVSSYTWTKNGLPILANNVSGQRIVADGPRLNISAISRNDAGSYICEAINSQGTDIIEVVIVVEYPAWIESVSEGGSFNVGEEAVLSCNVRGYPLTAEHVQWSRAGFDMQERTVSSFQENTAFLHIKDVQRKDIGNFTCTVNNQLGQADSKDVLLVVQSPPSIDRSPVFMRFAAPVGKQGQLICRSQASPSPSFLWRRHAREIKLHRSKKYSIQEQQIDALNFQSMLTIEQVSPEDFGQYECEARNTHGKANAVLEFIKPTLPDTPLKLKATNASDGSVLVKWTPSFDGGLAVHYRLRYKLQTAKQYQYIDVRRNSETNATLTGLQAGHKYMISVMAINDAGESNYLKDVELNLSRESGQPDAAEQVDKDEMPNLLVIGITSTAMVLLVLNAALVAWFVIRRQNKNSNENDAANDDAYSKDDDQSVYKLPITALKANVQNKASSTYLVENVDIIQSTAYPPKYQESSMCSPPYVCNPDFTRTLPNLKRHSANRQSSILLDPQRAKDDHILISNGLYTFSPSPASSLVIKGSYISSPSPAPPPDGSYFNMSDKYISYPPVTY